MLIEEYFERIYPCLKADSFYPSRKNHGIFVTFCFDKAGSDYFPYTPSRKLTSEDVPLQRKIYDGSRDITFEMQQSFHPFNVEGLAKYYEEVIIPEKINEVALSFGIPSADKVDTSCLCKALAIQLKNFVDNGGGGTDVDDIVALEYQRLLSVETIKENETIYSTDPFYPGDAFYMNSKWRPLYTVSCDEHFLHTWNFSNIGKQTWRGRKLFFSNHDKVRPRSEMNYIVIPDTAPGGTVKLTANMDARSFEGVTECQWIMIDDKGNNCFLNNCSFFFVVDTTFQFGKE